MKKQSITIVSLTGLVLAAAGYIYAATSFAPDDEPTNYLAPLAISSFNVTGGSETIFKGDYLRDGWQGNVYTYPISATGIVDQINDIWSGGAAAILDASTTVINDRKIVTLKADAVAGSPASKVGFTYSAIAASQQAALGDATTGPLVLNFIRGDRSNEKPTVTNGFRARKSRLGDIIHSRPYYTKSGSVPVLFVGANDGMLHAFNAEATDGAALGNNGGKELWAYVPSMLIPKLKNLTMDPYVHNYYVDGGLTVGDATLGTTQSKVLVSGLGAGGRGLFALNVTNPVPASTADAASKIMWEITPNTLNNLADTSYQNLGYTYGTPLVEKVNSGTSAVIMANGYNSGAKSSLFVINAATGALIKEIITGGATGGGLSSPRCLDEDDNGTVDYCYAGDIDGKLWKFNMNSATSSTWSASLMDTGGNTQAITMAPSLVSHPFGGTMVIFGTGNAYTQSAKDSNAVHYMYGIWDGAPALNDTLLTQTIAEKPYEITPAGGTTPAVNARVRVVTTNNTPDWSNGTGNHRGWKVAMPAAGERILGDTIFTDSGRVLFNATNPTVAGTTSVPAGENWLMELDSISGGSLNQAFLNLNNDGKIDDSDRVKNTDGTINLTNSGVVVGKLISNGVSSQPILVQLKTLNTTLFNENPDVIPGTAGTASTDGTPGTTTNTNDPGVAGGHFDIDTFYPDHATGWRKRHYHEYDDAYDTTGLDMAHPSDDLVRLNRTASFNEIKINQQTATINAMSIAATTDFKVLVHNQYLSPAVKISVGADPEISVKLYKNQAKETVAANVLANTPTYNQNSTGFNLEVGMPVTAFLQKDWWGEAGGTGFVAGRTSSGLHSTHPYCAMGHDNAAGTATLAAVNNNSSDRFFFNAVVPPANTSTGPGANSTTQGVRHNGALTIQIIKANTTAAMLELNVANRPEYGWRVNKANFANQVIAEYIIYWHHPRNVCYGDSTTAWKKANNNGDAWNTPALMNGTGWTLLPPEDIAPSKATPLTPAAGAGDPKGGTFTPVAASNVVTVTPGSGGTTGTPGTGSSAGNPGTGGSESGTAAGGTGGGKDDSGEQSGTRANTGRMSWTELYRN